MSPKPPIHQPTDPESDSHDSSQPGPSPRRPNPPGPHEPGSAPHTPKAPAFLSQAHDPDDPNPWLALYLDASVPIDDGVKQAWLEDSSTRSRQFLLPVLRPLARLTIIFIQLIKMLIPNQFTSSAMLHRLLSWGLRTWVTPTGNWLILRHFQLGAEILDFIRRNAGDVSIPALHDMRISDLDQVRDHVFLRHDLNLYNFVIYLNRSLHEQRRTLSARDEPDFEGISDGPLAIEAMPDRWTNFLDLASAIELFTPIYQLFLTDNDFWRATNSLQFDEPIAIYVAQILGNPQPAILVNNRHPMAPLSTLRAGARLVLHGLNTEMLHSMLVELKHEQASRLSVPQPQPTTTN